MMGPMTLKEVREKLEKALGPNPVGELDRQIAVAKQKGEGTQVMEELKRFVQRARRALRRKRSTTATK